jgi:hypothetical protein
MPENKTKTQHGTSLGPGQPDFFVPGHAFFPCFKPAQKIRVNDHH